MTTESAHAIISAILPPGAVGVDALGGIPDAQLFPEEAAVVERAVEKRRREFAAGRCLARRALECLGIPAMPILPGSNREPQWPEGVVGAITHCSGYCAAAVALSDSVAAIGIDAELNAALPDGVLRMVAREEEREWIHARTGDTISWDRLLFSAKESVYKAWFPLTHRWLDFDAVSVRFDPEAAIFHATLLTDGPIVDSRVIAGFDGRYLAHGPYLLTSVAVRRSGD